MSKKLINDINQFQKLANDIIAEQEEKGISKKIKPEDLLEK